MNLVAEKIEMQQESYEISLVPADKISLIWKKIEKYLKKSAGRSGGRTTIEDIYYELINNKTHLWIIYESNTSDISGVQITLFNIYPTGKKMLNLEHTAGTNMQDCRHGQWNWVKNKKGWKKPATFYEYIFEENK